MRCCYLNIAIAELYDGNIAAIDPPSTSFLIFASSHFIYNSLPFTPDVGKRRKGKKIRPVSDKRVEKRKIIMT